MTRAHAFRRSASRLVTILCVTCATATAQSNPDAALPTIHAARAVRPPVIDGSLVDEVWAAAEPVTRFTQRDPDEGTAPTELTEVRFLFDDTALYVGARLFDSEPTRIVHRLSMRDNRDADADVISIYLDPMHDHLTGAIFRVSAANIQQDLILFNDTWTDGAWDAVWQSAVMIDEMGWWAEVGYRLSELRFNEAG